MRNLWGLVIVCSSVLLLKPAQAIDFGADDVNGYVGLGYRFNKHIGTFREDVSGGSRQQFALEFGRLSRNVAIDLLFGSGFGYSDIGLELRIFQPFSILPENSSFLFVPGIDLAVSYSGSGLTRDSGELSKFTDTTVGPNLRFIYDTKLGFAVGADLSYSFVLSRNWTVGAPSSESSPLRKRLILGLSLLVSSRFIE